jgi:hypothetical protein
MEKRESVPSDNPSPPPATIEPLRDEEHRLALRVRAVLPVTVRLVRTGTSDVLSGHTRDVSANGISLQTIRPLAVGAKFLVYLSAAPPDGESLSLLYKVTRCDEMESGKFVVAATLQGRAAVTPQAAPTLTARDILRRIRIDHPPRK